MERGSQLSGSELVHLLTLGPAPYVSPPHRWARADAWLVADGRPKRMLAWMCLLSCSQCGCCCVWLLQCRSQLSQDAAYHQQAQLPSALTLTLQQPLPPHCTVHWSQRACGGGGRPGRCGPASAHVLSCCMVCSTASCPAHNIYACTCTCHCARPVCLRSPGQTTCPSSCTRYPACCATARQAWMWR